MVAISDMYSESVQAAVGEQPQMKSCTHMKVNTWPPMTESQMRGGGCDKNESCPAAIMEMSNIVRNSK